MDFLHGVFQAVFGKGASFHFPRDPLNAVGHIAAGNIRGVIADWFAPSVRALDGGLKFPDKGGKPIDKGGLSGLGGFTAPDDKKPIVKSTKK